jgi:acyl-CoA synthetase (AMP-forming)/AMP-acid ligase II
MIAREVQNMAQHQPLSPALVSSTVANSTQQWTYSQLAGSALSAAGQMIDCAGKQVGVWCDGAQPLLAALIALDSLRADVVLLPASATAEQVRKTASELQLTVVATNRFPIQTSGDGSQLVFRAIDFTKSQSAAEPTQQAKQPAGSARQVVLFTSGTSGVPKPAIHTWESLAAGVNRAPKYAGRRWLVAYELTAFAGIQVWLQALLTGGCVCVPQTRDPAAIAQLLLREQIEFASATPSFWRLLLHSVSNEELSQAALVQITLGGEAVDQPILDSLHSAFPRARITHIYASTEMGVCFTVSDGQAGFPAAYLSTSSLPCQLRISAEGELEILSQRTMLGYLSDPHPNGTSAPANPVDASRWFATGDLVQREGDRIYFVGRKSDTINVGGAKVYPADVERCIRSVPGVQQVRVYGMSSSLSGQLVAAEIQPIAPIDQEHLRADIMTACRQRLARHQVPAKITFCQQLPVAPSGKLTRKEVLHGT